MSPKGSASYRKTAVAVGNFDGVHLGHIHLINTLKREAIKRDLTPLVVTFEPHPASVLKKNGSFCRISTSREKREIIENQLGVKVEVIPFTEEFANTPPEEFIEGYLIERFGAALIAVGYDWRFGKGASGDIEVVKRVCSTKGCKVVSVPPYRVGGKAVKSSLVRELLRKARFPEAELYLGHPYWVKRPVVPGKGLGKKLGFPTLNIEEGIEELCLPNGVYAVCCDGHPAVANLGYAPTFKGDKRVLEVHILRDSFEVSKTPRVVFKRFIRPERGFKVVEELIERVKRDIELAKEILTTD